MLYHSLVGSVSFSLPNTLPSCSLPPAPSYLLLPGTLPVPTCPLLRDSASSLLPAPSCLPAPALSCLLSPACPLPRATSSIPSPKERGLGGSLPRRAPPAGQSGLPAAPAAPRYQPEHVRPRSPAPAARFCRCQHNFPAAALATPGRGGWRSSRPCAPHPQSGAASAGAERHDGPPGPMPRASSTPRLFPLSSDFCAPGMGKLRHDLCRAGGRPRPGPAGPGDGRGVQGVLSAWVLPRAAPALLSSCSHPAPSPATATAGTFGAG